MKKFGIEKMVGIIFIVLISFVIFKIYHFVIVNRAYDSVMKFIQEENRYYVVKTTKDNKIDCEEHIFSKSNQVKYTSLFNSSKQLYFEYRNFNTDVQYAWIEKEDKTKIINKSEKFIINRKTMIKLPTAILQIYKNNKLNIEKLFDIRYIILDKYEDKMCYKIVTKLETVIVDKETYLPVYTCKSLMNTDGETFSKIEYVYEFEVEVGNVTDEDMEM